MKESRIKKCRKRDLVLMILFESLGLSMPEMNFYLQRPLISSFDFQYEVQRGVSVKFKQQYLTSFHPRLAILTDRLENYRWG